MNEKDLKKNWRASSLVCADVRLNICFRSHDIVTTAFSYVIIFPPTSNALEIKAHREVWPQRESNGGGEPEVNNLVYRKRRKDIYANRKHETSELETATFAYPT